MLAHTIITPHTQFDAAQVEGKTALNYLAWARQIVPIPHMLN
jgi:hypothetical protein